MSTNNDNFREDIYNDYFSEQKIENTMSNVDVLDNIEDNTDFEIRVPSPQRKKKKKHRFLKFLFSLFCILLGLFIAFMAFAWVKTLYVPQKTNVLLMATDEDGTRTDTLMFCTFDKETKEISIISIPRDTYITVSSENYEIMNEDYPEPSRQSMKINAVHHFAGEKNAIDLTVNEVSRLMGADIDYYVKVDFDAFRYIIDSIGGIDFYVPQNMIYSDPYQDLYINLKEGQQTLNGEQAEHLLRYRSGYATADIGRIEVQQDFMKAFISQTISKGTVLTNPKVYLDAIFKYDFIKTNMSSLDIATYALLAGGIDADNVKTMTLPGNSAMRGGQSVYLPDVAKIENEVSKIIGN